MRALASSLLLLALAGCADLAPLLVEAARPATAGPSASPAPATAGVSPAAPTPSPASGDRMREPLGTIAGKQAARHDASAVTIMLDGERVVPERVYAGWRDSTLDVQLPLAWGRYTVLFVMVTFLPDDLAQALGTPFLQAIPTLMINPSQGVQAPDADEPGYAKDRLKLVRTGERLTGSVGATMRDMDTFDDRLPAVDVEVTFDLPLPPQG